MSWQRLKKFTCVVKKKNKQNDLMTVGKTTASEIHPASEKMAIPIRMVSAGVSNMSRLKDLLNKEEKNKKGIMNFLKEKCKAFRYSFFGSLIRWYGRKILKFFLIILLIIFVIEVIIAIWLWQMPTDEFNRLVSCLDIGSTAPIKERFVYYLACFFGAIGG